MCRSVPQMEAHLTFTRTSVRPKAGIFTSRTSAPGAASGFTTASMVPAIRATYQFDAENAADTKRTILAPLLPTARSVRPLEFVTKLQKLRANQTPPPRCPNLSFASGIESDGFE